MNFIIKNPFYSSVPHLAAESSTSCTSTSLKVSAVTPTQECHQLASPLMKKMIDAVIPVSDKGTVPSGVIGTTNDAETIQLAVKGEAIFKQIADAVRQAEEEVLL